MKRYIFASLLAGVVAFGLSSCEDDNDSNPVVRQPESFVLNTPAMAGNLYDLANSDSIRLTCSQPDYGYTAAVRYYAQVSLTDEWSNVVVGDDGTETEANPPKFVEIEGYSSSVVANYSAEQINSALQQMAGYDEETIPETIEFYIRLHANLGSGYDTYSNSVKLTAKPYYAVAAEPEMWYLIGACVGDGSWGSAIGTAVTPMCLVEGEEYDQVTGKGTINYTGYFPKELGFKLVKVPGDWAEQWGGVDGDITQPKKKEGDDEGSDFKVPESGYYTITLDTKANSLEIVKAAKQDYSVYSRMSITGVNNDWNTFIDMSPVDTYEGAVPHVWKLTYTFDADTEIKFLANGAWDTKDGGNNWGSTGFPYGWGSYNGSNVPVKAGTYLIILNDITGFYQFIAQ